MRVEREVIGVEVVLRRRCFAKLGGALSRHSYTLCAMISLGNRYPL